MASPLGESLAYRESGISPLRQPTNRGYPNNCRSLIEIAALPDPLYPLYSLAIHSPKGSLPTDQHRGVRRQY